MKTKDTQKRGRGNRVVAKLSDKAQSQCDNCGRVWRQKELKEAKDLDRRVDPGGPTPSGECPECGALCYPKSSPEVDRSVLRGKNGSRSRTTLDRSQLKSIAERTVDQMGDIFWDRSDEREYRDPREIAVEVVFETLERLVGGDRKCPTCGEVHPPCSVCGAPTRCPEDEPGEPFTMCDDCDSDMT